MRGGKQCRRRYACPRDPRTLEQMRSRGRLTAASRNYSQSLPDAQRDACIAAGAKVQSRPRLGQSGPLTGQQYWVRSDSARQKAKSKVTKLTIATKVPQPQRVARSTSGPHHAVSRPPPEQHRLKTRPAREVRGGRHYVEPKANWVELPLEVAQNQPVTGNRRGRSHRPPGITGVLPKSRVRLRVGRGVPAAPRASVGARKLGKCRRTPKRRLDVAVENTLNFAGVGA
jgi:hypothetical protein